MRNGLVKGLLLSLLLWSHSSWAYERAISLAPHITELIYAIGAEDRLVATVESSDYPPAALELARVGDGVTLAIEQLLLYEPDVIFAWQPNPTLEAIKPILQQKNIDLFYLNPQSLADISATALLLGDWLGQPKLAKLRHDEWQALTRRLKQQHKVNQHRLFIVLNSKPLYSLNDPLVNEVIELCGASNWADSTPTIAPIVSIESLLARPATALVTRHTDEATTSLQQLLERIYGHDVPVFHVEADHFYRAGPRLFEAAFSLCAQLANQPSTAFSD